MIRHNSRSDPNLSTGTTVRLVGGDSDGPGTKVSPSDPSDDGSPTGDDFIPADILHAVAFGCVVWGDAGPPPFAEVQVFVKFG